MFFIGRHSENPILRPNPENSWEAEAVFNGCPVRKGNEICLLYRALSLPHYHAGARTSMMVSDIGIASSGDGIHFANRRRFIVPEESWEAFGCEDPRVTKLGGTYYIFYTAIEKFPPDAGSIKVAVALSRDLAKVEERHLVTPFNAKAMSLFPEKIGGKMAAILTVHTDMPPAKIAVALFDKPEDMWTKEYWERWHDSLDDHVIPLQTRPDDHIEAGGPPIKTKDCWLFVYSYIRNYNSPNRIFGIEAALLDLKNPQKIIARTQMPLMIPEEFYEKYGMVPNIIFPSGLLAKNDELRIYYGGADTVVCVATASLRELIRYIQFASARKPRVCIRMKMNPIIAPRKEYSWEAKAAFNPAAFLEGGNVHIVYRAMSEQNVSVFGYATSKDGVRINWRSEEPIYVPRELFEIGKAGGNSGCEDPRITRIGDILYMCYTAFDGANPPRVALTSIPVKSFIKRDWSQWKHPVLISPPGADDKDACIFPEKVDGKYLIFHRLGDDIDIALVSSLDFDGSTWLEERRWLKPRPGFWDARKVGVAAPPVKVRKGWILFYHGVSADGVYRVGAVLLDIKDPTRIIGRTIHPICEPETIYEREGHVSNVFFPCGAVLIGGHIRLYYGGGDRVIGVVTIEVEKLLAELQ